ncbi:hypothetical protein LTS15_007445 [Exophiala xenobiotica]|nr:hypothetical protein LTS15_007445 [Exophiala xenobiotica]
MAINGVTNVAPEGAINAVAHTVTNGALNGVTEADTNNAHREPAPIEATEAYKKYPLAYELSKMPFLWPRRMKVIVAGAGASALSLAHEVQTGVLKNIDLHILEKNQGLGGTWFENQYPGCACDIPAHAYLFTWAPNPRWSEYYVTAPEILKYFEEVAKKYQLNQYITTGRKVVGAEWNDEKQQWLVHSRQTDGRRTVVSSPGITDGEVGEDIIEECDIFINASGYFNHWRWPTTPGRDIFKGQLLHSADYNPKTDLKGKKVGLIGNGSSGIQITAAIQKEVSELTVFMRNPTWITASLGSSFVPANGEPFTEEQKAFWAKNPDEYLKYRKAVEKELNDGFPFFIHGTKAQADALDFTTKDMKRRLAKKPELAELLLPTYPVGCRRPTPGTGYLEALCADNVEIAWGELDSFTAKGIKSADGTEREFDVIICATGFDMSMVPRWPTIGLNGVDLQKKWKEDPAAYLSAIANDMPNYFVYMGPGAPVGHGSLLPSIERVTLYIVDMINKLQTQNYSSFLLKPGKAKNWQSQMLAWLEKTVWGDNCQSSFKNGTVDGKLYSFHGGSRLHYFELLRMHRYEDFEWKSRCPEPELEFAWLASGFLQQELHNKGEDNVWYFNQEPEVLTSFIGE